MRGQIDATHELITINTKILEILRNQYAKGYVSQLDVAAQESQLAQVTAILPPLLKQLAQQRDLLAALSGGFPSQDLPETFELSTLQLPHMLPVSLPSQLIEQRPDVRQAEENLHSASALIGVARASRLPNFALTADVGSMALIFSKLFSSGTGFWDLGAGGEQHVFQGGTLTHKERAARAAFVQASEQYRSTVVTAFQSVADTLNALQQDADGLKAASAAKDAASATLDLTKKQLDSGYASYLALLSAEQAYQQALLNLAQARANRYADTAALFQALGGDGGIAQMCPRTSPNGCQTSASWLSRPGRLQSTVGNWFSLRLRDASMGAIGVLLIVLGIILVPLAASFGMMPIIMLFLLFFPSGVDCHLLSFLRAIKVLWSPWLVPDWSRSLDSAARLVLGEAICTGNGRLCCVLPGGMGPQALWTTLIEETMAPIGISARRRTVERRREHPDDEESLCTTS